MGYSRPQGQVQLFILVSILIHVLAVLIWWHKPLTPTNLAKKTSSVTISVGLQAALAGTVDTVASSKIPTQEPTKVIKEKSVIKETIPTEIKTPTVVKKQPAKKSKPIIKKIKPKTKKTETVKKPKPIIKEEVKPKIISKPQKVLEKKSETPIEKNTIAGQSGIDGSANVKSKVAETGTQSSSGGSQDEQFDRYVRQHLLSQTDTTRFRKTRRREGDVMISFTIDRDGNLIDKKIVKSSHDRQFDRAAIKQVRKADPYPKAPIDSTWKQRSFSIVIHYQVN